jgi:hypothetical protein
MLDHPIQDPEVARLRADLQASLNNMAAGMERLATGIEARCHMAPRAAAATVSVRIDQALERRLASFMRQSGITNQARAMRLLMAMALTTAGVKE